MKREIETDVDVIIVGGGLIGCTLAAILAQQDIECLIIEASDAVAGDSGARDGQNRIDPRALAITPASRNILRTAGAWKYLPPDRIGRFREMHAWDENGKGEIHFDSGELCEPVMGYIIELSLLETVLEKTLEHSGNIRWCRPATPISYQLGRGNIHIKLDDDSEVVAKLIVAADGARSRMRTLAGIDYPRHDYRQKAVACIVKTEREHKQVARQRFLNRGPLAFLPMGDPLQCGIIWSTSPDHADALLAMDEPEFNQALGQAFDNTLGDILSSGRRAAFSLQHAQASSYCQQRLVLVGDAAHTVHPLAGQGANLGLLDAATLAEVMLSARDKNRDIGSHAVLRRYERWRKGENFAMIKILQGFKYLFENNMQAVIHLRNLGLDITDTIKPLKHLIMRHAMGLAGDLPTLARARV